MFRVSVVPRSRESYGEITFPAIYKNDYLLHVYKKIYIYYYYCNIEMIILSWFCENRSTDVGCVSATVLYSKLIRLDEIAFRQSKRSNPFIFRMFVYHIRDRMYDCATMYDIIRENSVL